MSSSIPIKISATKRQMWMLHGSDREQAIVEV